MAVSKSIHTPVNGSPFILLSNIPSYIYIYIYIYVCVCVCVCCIFFIPSSVEDLSLLSHFHVLAIVNSAAINIGMHLLEL